MAEIRLTNNKGVAIVDDEWYPILSKFQWHLTNKGYAARSPRPGHSVQMHRVVNMTPAGLQTDHINGNKLDNRACNLRPCTNAENCSSRSTPRGKSGYWGVTPIGGSGRWQASISKNYKGIYIGSFDTAEEAARAYDETAKRIHGQFAKLNFPVQEVAA